MEQESGVCRQREEVTENVLPLSYYQYQLPNALSEEV